MILLVKPIGVNNRVKIVWADLFWVDYILGIVLVLPDVFIVFCFLFFQNYLIIFF